MRKMYPYLIALLTLISINMGYSQADNCAAATNLSGTQLNGSCNNFNYSANPGDPFFLGTCGHNNGTPYIWWRFTAQNPYLNVQFEPGFEIALVNFGGPVCQDNGGAMTIITNCNNSLETNSLVNGQEYYLMVTFNGSNPGNTCMRIYNPGNIPANDNCNNAISIPSSTLSSDACPGGGTTFTFGTPTQDVVNFNCNAPQTNLNIWFSFVAQGPYVEIQGFPGVEFFIMDFNGANCVYDAGTTNVIGACGPGAPLESYDLVIGQQYYVMATATVPNLPTSTFNLCIFNPVPPPNNECDDVINLTSAMLNCMSGGTSYEFGYATTDVAIVPECGHDQFTPNIWFSFTARGSYARIRGVNGFQFFLVDFTGNICDAAGAFLIPTVECNDGTDIEFHDLEEGKVYYIMVASTAANPPANVNLCVFNPEYPDNDEPCDAMALNNGGCHNGSTLSSYPEIAGGIPGQNCGTTNNLDDVWYSINLGNRDYGVNITLSNITGFNEDIMIAVYSEPDFGGCSQLQLTSDINFPADCYPGGTGMEILHLHPGKQYYIRVTSTSANDHGTFTICANYIAIPEPCSYGDNCANVEVVDSYITIPFDPFEDCNGGTGMPSGFSGCFAGCNIGSTPDNPPINSNCIQANWRTTWYRFNSRTYGYADLRLTKSTVNGILAMGMDLFDACSGQSVLNGNNGQCLFSPEGENQVNITLIPIEENTDYYLAIGSPASQTGHYDICINIYDVPAGPDDECAGGRPIITPDILPPYSPGDIVNFHVFIPPYSQTNTIQWLQAVIPVFGEGWAPPSFSGFNGPPTTHTTPNGNWDWYGPGQITYNYTTTSYQLYVDELGRPSICHFSDCPEGIGGCLTEGDRLPAGWYAYQDGGSNGCVPGSGDPNLGWGDGTGPWEFTFTLMARQFEGVNGCDATGFIDLGVSIYIMSDQQTGCWDQGLGADACRSDLPGKFEAQNKCCKAPEVNHNPAPICSEGNFSYNIITTQDADGDISLSWSLTYPPQLELLSGAAGGTGRAINNSFRNQSGATLTATYTIRTINAAGCDGISSFMVNILSELDVEVPDPPVLCPGASVTLTPTISGGTGTFSTYLWNPGGHTGPTYTVSPSNTTSYTVLVRDSQGCEGQDQVTVRVAQDFTARIEDGPTEFCVNDEFPQKYVTAAVPSSGEGPFNYNWGGGAFDLAGPPRTINPLVSANYIVTITDVHGCPKTANIDITVHGLPYLEILSEDTFCENEEAFDFQFISQGNSGTAPVKLIQNDYYINPVLFVVDPPFIAEYFGLGTYYVTLEATDPETGCINTIDYELTIEGKPEILFDMDPVCFGTQVISLADAIFPFNGTFSSEVLPPDILFPYGAVNSAELEPGVYEFYYEVDNGVCTALDTFSFEIAEGPELFLSINSPYSLVLDCNVQSHGVSILNPGTSNDYTWYHVETATTTKMKDITITVPGTYIATFEDNAGCLARDTVRVLDDTRGPDLAVDEPLINIICGDEFEGQIIVEVDGEVNVNPADFNFGWTVVNGTGTIDGNLNIGNYNGEGTYRLTVLNPQNGCSEFLEIEVAVDTLAPVLDVSNDVVIDCLVELPVTLSSITDPGQTLEFIWTTVTGTIPSGQENEPEISITEEGLYTVRVVNPDNACFTERTIAVEDVREIPEAELAFDPVLNCYNEENFEIGIIAEIANSSIEWWLGGNPVPGSDNSPSISIEQGGTYTVILTNLDNNCEFEADISITDDRNPPSVDAGGDQEILCSDNGEKQLVGSSSGANVSYLWTASPGNISSSSDPTSPSIIVEASGIYILTVTNLDNGCTATDQAIVSPSTDIPQVEASEDLVIDCATIFPLVLNAQTQIGGLNYTWTATNGGVIPAGQENQQQISVNVPGTYVITVVNPANDCQNSDNVVISDIRETPSAQIEFADVLNCSNLDNSQIVIVTNVSNPNFQWFLNESPIGSGNGLNSWQVESGGDYEVIITNLDNQCQETFLIEINEDLNPPAVDAGGNQEILCSDNGSIQLIGSSLTPNVSYLWTANPGSITTNPPTQSTITIGGPGSYTLTVTSNTNGCTSSEQVVVTASDDIPVVNAGADLEFLCSTTSLELQATSNVGGGETYTWTRGGNNVGTGASVTVNQPGTYTVTVFNPLNGCTNSDQVVISDQRINPDVSAGPDLTMECSDEGQKVITGTSATPGAIYNWSGGNILPPANQAQVTVLSPGTYTLTVTNPQNDCTSTDFMVVEESTDIPPITAPDELSINCFQQADGVVITANSPVSGIEYLWSSSESFQGDPTGSSITVFAPGTYNISVVNPDNGCTNSKNIILSGDFEQPEVDAGLDSEVDCINTTTTLSGSSPDNVMYSWTATNNGNIISGANTSTPTVNAAGTYVLTVIDQDNGCVNQDQVIVVSNDEYPHVGNLQNQILGCEEFSVLTAVANSSTPGVSFSWTTAGGSILEGVNTNMIVFDEVGTYTVEVLNPENGCRSYASFEATFTTDLPVANAGEDQEITCDEKTVILSGSASSQGSITYTWTEVQYGNEINNPNSPIISVDLTGTYILTVRNNENGCSDTDQVIVFAEDNVLSNVVLDERDVRCFGEGNGRVTITQFVGGVAPYRIMFNGSPVGTQTSFGPLLPGAYNFDIVDANGCELFRTVVIEEPDSLSVSIGQDTVIVKGDFVRTDPVIFGSLEGLTYVWDTSRVEFSNVNGSLILTPPHTIRLTLTITDPNGCRATDNRLIIVERDPHIYVPNILVPNSSVNGRLTVDAGPEVKFIKSFVVFDRWGNFIYENKNFEPNTETIGWDGTFGGKPVQTGVFVYFLVAVLQDGSERLVEGDVTVVY